MPVAAEQWSISNDSLNRFFSAFQAEMRRGLAGEPSSIAMHPSFVSRPSGDERGQFVALDLGGTNVRATVVEITDDGLISVLRHESFRLTSVSGSSSDLFDPIAGFIGTILDEGREYNLGFIFAFPADQLGVRSGRLSKWTKEFAFEGVEGEDVVTLLEQSIQNKVGTVSALRGLTISALANDTVGVMAAGAYLDPRCDMGLIVGTGTNMAAAIPTSLVARDLPPAAGNPNEMLFNMECGNFEGVQSIQTDYDRLLDAESDTQGQLLEKMISGRYLGEIVRLTVADLASRGESFDSWLSEASVFRTPYAFTSEHLSDIAYDSSQDLAATAMLLKRLGVSDVDQKNRRRLRDICVSIAQRSAQLVAMSIVATATYIDPELEQEHLVAADGSVFRGYPGYQTMVEQGIRDILGDRADRVQVSYLRDGSGMGAAVVAAVAAND